MTYAIEFLIAAIQSKENNIYSLEKEIRRLEGQLSEYNDRKQEVLTQIAELNTILESLTQKKEANHH